MQIQTLTVVGVGLIGGSVALAARGLGVARHIVGVDQSDASLERACRGALIHEGTTDLERGVSGADLVIFCTPVDRIAGQVLAAARHCRPDACLTDVGSTKAGIVRAVEKAVPGRVAFVGSHPLAGSEKSGPEYANAQLFQDRLVVVTPTEATCGRALEQVKGFWRLLGARLHEMGPEEHDRALALTSHLPHLLASALAGILPPGLHELTASGFRDTTRLAAGHPGLWTAILQANQAGVLAALERLEEQLGCFRAALSEGDVEALHTLLQQGKQVREALQR
jgi:prephenate dehydrogenase